MGGMAGQPLIAIVDDEASVRRALGRMLSASLFAVQTFASGQEFLDTLHGPLPDCLVLDYQMPGLTGREVQQRLQHARLTLPVIVMTAHDQPALREQCLADGAVAYLAKPLQRERLVGSIRLALGLGPADA
jgi:FixJ family two-component response regulator